MNVPILKNSKFVHTYYRAKDILPQERRLVRVAPNDEEMAFCAERHGRTWRILHWSKEEWGYFTAKINKNDWWTYLKEKDHD